MAHAVETMAYAGQTPWHGLGTKVEDDLTPEEFLKAAGLDWNVERIQLFMKDNFEAVDQYAIRRDTDKRVFGFGGAEWEPFQNHEVMGFFDEFCEQNGFKIETAGSLHKGRTIWALAKAPGSAKIQGRDEILRYYLLTNSHRPGTAFRYAETMVRVVCANTLSLATAGANVFKLAHRGEFETHVEKIAKNLRLRDSVFEQATERFEAYADTSMSDAQLRGFANLVTGNSDDDDADENSDGLLDKIIEREESRDILDELKRASTIRHTRTGAKILEAITDSPGQDGFAHTAWGALNGVTFWADHAGDRDDERRASSLLSGTRARRKRKAVDLLDQVVEASTGQALPALV